MQEHTPVSPVALPPGCSCCPLRGWSINVLMPRLAVANPRGGASQCDAACGPSADSPGPTGLPTWLPLMVMPHGKGDVVASLQRQQVLTPVQQGTSIAASRPIVRGSVWLAGHAVRCTRPCPRQDRNLMSSGRVMPPSGALKLALSWNLQ
jgi:hypothetical protein